MAKQIVSPDVLSALRGFGALGLFVVGVYGCIAILVGLLDASAVSPSDYHVKFGSPGSSCDSDDGPVFGFEDGEALACGRPGSMNLNGDVEYPGFTEAQNSEVAALARKAGELSPSEMDEIQGLVNRIAATVPSSRLAYDKHAYSIGPLWGTDLAWAGGATVVVVAGIAAATRDRRRP
ncbi:hypothetical protein [Streptomyces sp. Je 1-369]|uniref:hypothetical protein n=1 Tax=Streptomyces sp. Je 1-369 TaxID=2966192 RepID=UPI0022865886|nr:hypothetical protein [Streptomyces sp. Je 1-369]WAL93240.1 hypothetical protein NOO62_01275 [Streptomyces sp. Je 1-369]